MKAFLTMLKPATPNKTVFICLVFDIKYLENVNFICGLK